MAGPPLNINTAPKQSEVDAALGGIAQSLLRIEECKQDLDSLQSKTANVRADLEAARENLQQAMDLLREQGEVAIVFDTWFGSKADSEAGVPYDDDKPGLRTGSEEVSTVRKYGGLKADADLGGRPREF